MSELLDGMNALTLVFTLLLIFVIAYRFYGIFMAHRVLAAQFGYLPGAA